LVEKGIHPLSLRLVFLEHRYRQQMDLTWNSLKAADKTLKRWYRLISEWQKSGEPRDSAGYSKKIQSFMEDDLDTVNVILLLREVEKSQELSSAQKIAIFLSSEKWLGLGFAEVKTDIAPAFSQEVLDLAAERESARKNKDFARSDEIRDELARLGVLVTDTAAGQSLTRLQ
jgi:cysteinyl-tRNA synthetase